MFSKALQCSTRTRAALSTDLAVVRPRIAEYLSLAVVTLDTGSVAVENDADVNLSIVGSNAPKRYSRRSRFERRPVGLLSTWRGASGFPRGQSRHRNGYLLS